MRIACISYICLLGIGIGSAHFTNAQNAQDGPNHTTEEQDQWYHKTGRVCLGTAVGALDSIIPILIGYKMQPDSAEPHKLQSLQNLPNDATSIILEFPFAASITSFLSAELISFLGCNITTKQDIYYKLPHNIIHLLCSIQLYQHENQKPNAAKKYIEQEICPPSSFLGIPISETTQMQICCERLKNIADNLDDEENTVGQTLNRLDNTCEMQIVSINTSAALGSWMGSLIG